MNILVDARPIVDATSGGVKRVAREFVATSAKEHPTDAITCVTTGWHRPTLPEELRSLANVSHRHIRIPNKLLSLLVSFGFPLATFYSLLTTRPADAIILPNIGFIGTLPKHVPTTIIIHDLSFLIEPAWFSWRQRLWHRAVRAKHLLTSATSLLAVSETTKQDAIRLLNIPENRIRVIKINSTFFPNDERLSTLHSPLSTFHSPLSTFHSPLSTPYILALGVGDKRKNVGTAIEAVRRLRDDEASHDVELVLVGKISTPPSDSRLPTPDSRRATCDERRATPDVRSHPDFASGLPIPDSWLHFIHRPSDGELAALYKNAAAFLYPSWYEGYGLPLHEAASFGTPCIASTAGALPETAPPGTFFADPAKPHHWVEALRLVMQKKKPPQ